MQPAAVLDANVYRSLAGARFDAFLDLERGRRVAPYADPWIIMELLVHVADPRDRACRPCRRAVRRIWVRCVERRDPRAGAPAAADAAKLLGVQWTAVAAVVDANDHHTTEFRQLAEEWLEENHVRRGLPRRGA